MRISLNPKLLISALALAAGLPAMADHYDVVLLGGQSNMLGRASTSGLATELANDQTDVLFYYNSSQSVTDNANKNTLTALQTGSGTDIGPEVAFGRTVADGQPLNNFALIKYAVGGTNLYSQWDPNTGGVYSAFETTVNNGLAALTAAGHTYDIKAMLWTQGESDASSRSTSEYEADLNELIAAVRSDFIVADLPFFISLIADTQTAVGNRNVIRAAQANVAAGDVNAYLVDTDGMQMKGDNLHFDTTGQVQLGEAFAASYIANVPEPTSLALLGLGGLLLARRRR